MLQAAVLVAFVAAASAGGYPPPHNQPSTAASSKSETRWAAHARLLERRKAAQPGFGVLVQPAHRDGLRVDEKRTAVAHAPLSHSAPKTTAPTTSAFLRVVLTYIRPCEPPQLALERSVIPPGLGLMMVNKVLPSMAAPRAAVYIEPQHVEQVGETQGLVRQAPRLPQPVGADGMPGLDGAEGKAQEQRPACCFFCRHPCSSRAAAGKCACSVLSLLYLLLVLLAVGRLSTCEFSYQLVAAGAPCDPAWRPGAAATLARVEFALGAECAGSGVLGARVVTSGGKPAVAELLDSGAREPAVRIELHLPGGDVLRLPPQGRVSDPMAIEVKPSAEGGEATLGRWLSRVSQGREAGPFDITMRLSRDTCVHPIIVCAV